MPPGDENDDDMNWAAEITVAGVDIGGTQCSVNFGRLVGGELELLSREQFPTAIEAGPGAILDDIERRLARALDGAGSALTNGKAGPGSNRLAGIGVSCGGPLDSEQGVVHSPPNLPGWGNVAVVSRLAQSLKVPTFLENDANASALAEWRFGAARGARNMVFLTFGTGLGAGLVLDGRLYRGELGLAGEVGHWRVGPDKGPVRYGKAGSLESFSSGSGIAGWYEHLGGSPDPDGRPSAKVVADRARKGDELAVRVFETAAVTLGRAVALVADLLAPEVVVIGGIFGYAHDLLHDGVDRALSEEALPAIRRHLRVVPAGLGELLGSHASCCVALAGLARSGSGAAGHPWAAPDGGAAPGPVPSSRRAE